MAVVNYSFNYFSVLRYLFVAHILAMSLTLIIIIFITYFTFQLPLWLWILLLAEMSSEQQINNELLKTNPESTGHIDMTVNHKTTATRPQSFEKLKPKKPNGKFFYQSFVISSQKPTYLMPLTPMENESSNLYIYYSDESASAPINLRGHND